MKGRVMKNKMLYILFCFLCLSVFSLSSLASRFGNPEKKIEELDEAIVKAYNAEPKRTAQIYSYCLEMIEYCSSSNIENRKGWISKARKVITLACANEVTEAINEREYKKAYEWVNKGLEKGASEGSEAGYNVEELYKFLKETQKKLEDHFDTYNIPYDKPTYSYTTSRNKQLSNKLFNKR